MFISFRIERSRNCTVLDNFTQRVHDRQKVHEIRDNILVHTSKDDTRPIPKLPAMLQYFMQSKALSRELNEARHANTEMRRRERSSLEDVFENSKSINQSLRETSLQTFFQVNGSLLRRTPPTHC